MANRRCRLLDGLVMATVRVLRSIVDLWACAGWGFLHRHPVVMGDREGGLPAYPGSMGVLLSVWQVRDAMENR